MASKSSRKDRSQQRLSAQFDGHVQGVGFRYTVVSIAASYEVTGYVKNEWDGSVSLVAEGAREELTAFYQAIRQSRLSRYIVGDSASWDQAIGEFSGFGVKF